MNRRLFLRNTGLVLAGGLAAGTELTLASENSRIPKNPFGVLVDTTLCIGCRRCELACDRKNKLSGKTAAFFDDRAVFNERRNFSVSSYTVVNRYPNNSDVKKPFYVKTQCMHCNQPACVSACIVGALKKQPDGPVTYDYDKCIGCRYCMVACPFQVPAYEYSESLTPHVMKCNFCFDLVGKTNGTPACVDACPVSTMMFGRRDTLLGFGHKWLARQPERYVNHIYGESEAGGTSWMYLAGAPFETLGLPPLGTAAPPELSEKIQHSVFKKWIPPLAMYAVLGAAAWIFRRRGENGNIEEAGDS